MKTAFKFRINAVVLGIVFLFVRVSCSNSPPPTPPTPPDVEPPPPSVCASVRVANLLGQAFTGAVFDNTSLISIPAFSYSDEKTGTLYRISGDDVLQLLGGKELSDCCDAVRYLDKTSERPSLKWTLTEEKLVAVAIVKNRVGLDITKTRISNQSDIVWTWHTGMGGETVETGATSVVSVPFAAGRNVINGDISYDTEPQPLDWNRGYVWFVWAWDDNGRKITRSSRQLPFIVGGVAPVFELKVRKQLEGKWDNTLAVDTKTKRAITSNFLIKSVEFKVSDYYSPNSFTNDCTITTLGNTSLAGQWSLYNRVEVAFDSPSGMRFRNVWVGCDKFTCEIIPATDDTSKNIISAEFTRRH